MRKTSMLIAAFAALAACGGSDEPAGSTPSPRESTVFEPMTDTLERAAGVEDTLRDAAAERRRQLEAQE